LVSLPSLVATEAGASGTGPGLASAGGKGRAAKGAGGNAAGGNAAGGNAAGGNGASGNDAGRVGADAPSRAITNGEAFSQLRTVDRDTPHRVANAERLIVANAGSSRSCSSA
jgi:hypothetical protein